MKKLMALAMSLLMTGAILAGCGGGGSNDAPAGGDAPQGDTAAVDEALSADEIAKKNEGTVIGAEEDGAADGAKRTDLRMALAATTETLDPVMNTTMDGANYINHYFEPLLRYKRDGSGIEAGVAESHDVSEDGLVWTFHLRDNAKWSDGQPVTAKDFEYAFKRLVDPAVAAPYALDMGAYLKNGAAIVNGEKPVDELGVKVIDDHTIELTLEGPCAYFEEIIAFPTFSPIRQDMIETYGAEKWATAPESYISNGAFTMSEFTLDSQMVALPNEHYWESDTIVPTSITFLFLADEAAELNAFRSGEADFIEDAPEEEIRALIEAGDAEYRSQLGIYYFDFQNQKEPFNDVNVRKAFSLALDREYIANVVRQGAVYPAYAFVGNGFNDATEGSDFRKVGGDLLPTDYEESKKQALEALAAAGYKTPENPDGKDFPLVEFIYNEQTLHQTLAQAAQNMWKEVLGVEVTLSSQEWQVFTDTRRKGDFEMARDGWISDYNDPSSLLGLGVSSSGNNNAQYKSEEFDAIMEKVAQSGDQAVRMEAMHEAEKLYVQTDSAVAPLYYYADQLVYNQNLKNWGYTPVGYKFFHHSYVAE